MSPGLEVFVTDALPIAPGHREVARRTIRHGLADVLRWLGEDVGPQPDAATDALRVGNALYVSRDLYERLVESADPHDAPLRRRP